MIPAYYLEKSQNINWFLMFIFSRFALIRHIALFLASFKSFSIPQQENSIFEKIEVEQAISDLEKDGIFQGFQLPLIYIEQILQYALTNNCYADRNPHHGFKYYQHHQAERICHKSIMRGEYINVLFDCPSIAEIARDSKVIEIAGRYLKTKPILMEARLWWNFIVDESKCNLSKGARTFHYDLDDYRCVVFFFYLTDVDLESGPHVCVRGSHKKKKLKYLLSLNLNRPDTEIINYYGSENIVTITGKSGCGFIEDKFIYHKANSPRIKNRLLLYLQFGINKYKSDDYIDPKNLKSCIL